MPKKSTETKPSKSLKETLSVSSIKEKTRQGLKRLTSKTSIKKAAVEPSKTCSPAVKNVRAKSDENTPVRKARKSQKPKTAVSKKQSPDQNLKMARRRVPVSMSSALQEVKGNFTKAVENVSSKLKLSSRGRSVRKSLYDPLVGNDTPVKMYSPFSISEDTPDGRRTTRSSSSKSNTPIAKNQQQTRRNLMLDTPTAGKYRKDLEEMCRGFQELETISRRLRDRQQNEQIWG